MRTSSYFYNIFMGGWIKTNVGSFVQANYIFEVTKTGRLNGAGPRT
jgi:hypothetical protein